MNSPKYDLKDKKIRIFLEDNDGQTKRYIHSKNTYLNAYVRQLSASEQTSIGAVKDASDIEFVINHRNIVVDMFVEFKDKTYQISGVDNFEFLCIETKFRAYEVNQKEYEMVRWLGEDLGSVE